MQATTCGAAHALATRSIAAADAPGSDVSVAPGRALLARVALFDGDVDAAATHAEAAYRVGLTAGGFDLGAAAPVHVWVLLRQGRLDEAEAVAELLGRQVGRHDTLARVQVALVRLALAASGARVRPTSSAPSGVCGICASSGTHSSSARRDSSCPRSRRATRVARGDGVPPLHVLVLGPAAIRVGDRELTRTDWKSHKALEVACFLALAEPRGAGREAIIEAVWPDRDPDKGRTLLRTALSEIRRVLEPLRPAGEPSSYLDASADRVVLHATTDLAAARALAAAGSPRDALAQFRGGFFEDDPYAEWANDDRRAAETLLLEVADRVAADPSVAAEERIAAFELLIEKEDWRSEHYTRLAALYRELGDEPAARSAERRRDFEE